MMRRRVLVVIPASYQEACNADALIYDPVGGSATFTVPLSATGLLPATHYWMSASVSEATYQAMLALLDVYPLAHMEEWDMDNEAARPGLLLSELGLKVFSPVVA